jgi:hypothetical protein
MNFYGQMPRHPTLLDFYVKIMKVKVSLHLHVKKIKFKCISILLITPYFEFKWLFVNVQLIV